MVDNKYLQISCVLYIYFFTTDIASVVQLNKYPSPLLKHKPPQDGNKHHSSFTYEK